MTTATVSKATEQIRNELTDGLDKLKELSGTLKDGFDTARDGLQRGARYARTAAKDAAKDARSGIRQRPLTAVVATAACSATLGLALGWLIGYRRRR